MHSEFDLMQQQEAIEREMVQGGIDAYRAAAAEARASGSMTSVASGRSLLRMVIDPVAEAIEQWVEKAKEARRGRRASSIKFIDGMEYDVLALLTSRCVLDGIASDRPLVSVAIALGNAVEDERRFAEFSTSHKRLFEAVKKSVRQRTSNKQWQRAVLVHASNEHGDGWEPWLKTDKLRLGAHLVELFCEATGMADIKVARVAGKESRARVQPTQAAVDFLASKDARCELLTPQWMPCVVPPKPWSGPHAGGYHYVRRLKAVKTHSEGYTEELRNMADDMADVYGALNRVQATAWRINRRVLEVMQEMWDGPQQHGVLPARDPQDLPPKPANIATDRDALVAWKRAAARVYSDNAKLASKRIQTTKILYVAGRYVDHDAVYFPHQLDFRGRMYAVPLHLHPQGPDTARSLLTFAHGKPIEDEVSAGWLAIHGANTFGYDKASFDERVQWVDDHYEQIMAVASDPLENRWWMDADKKSRWQFLAWCFEWAAFQSHGYGYVSCLPVQLDGSCNGLQHYSAMLRDPVGGEATNLTPAAQPQDIYQRVCDVVVEKLEALEGAVRGMPVEDSQDHADAVRASQWLSLPLDRKLTKRPVMVLPYGGTLFSCRQYVTDWLQDYPDHPFGDDTFAAATWMAKHIWAAIGEVVVAARSAMDWLQKAARVAAAEGLPVVWTTPDGFPVMQAYPQMADRLVETKLGARAMRIRLTLREAMPAIDRTRQANGIAPNFVHSLDACALRQYVCIAEASGVQSFSVIHDSYGTLAADTELSAACLREAFADMYLDHDVLGALRDSIAEMLPPEKREALPPLPECGTLELERVKESLYFFA